MHITILLHKLRGGGVQRSLLHLAHAFVAQGHNVDLVVLRDAGPGTHGLPEGVLRDVAPSAFVLVEAEILHGVPIGFEITRPVQGPLGVGSTEIQDRGGHQGAIPAISGPILSIFVRSVVGKISINRP